MPSAWVFCEEHVTAALPTPQAELLLSAAPCYLALICLYFVYKTCSYSQM